MSYSFVCFKPNKKLYLYKDGIIIKTYNCAIGGGKDIGGNGAIENGYATGGIWNDYLTPIGNFKITTWISSNQDMIVTIDGKKYNIWKKKIKLNCQAIDPNTNKMIDKGIRIHATNPDQGSSGTTHGCIRISQSDLEDIWNTIDNKKIYIPISITTQMVTVGPMALLNDGNPITTGMENSKLNFVSVQSDNNV